MQGVDIGNTKGLRLRYCDGYGVAKTSTHQTMIRGYGYCGGSG